MTRSQAIQIGNAFVLQHRGVQGEPEHVQLMERAGKKRSWSLVYGAALFFPTEIAEGTVIDGGEYILTVDDVTGQASHFVFLG